MLFVRLFFRAGSRRSLHSVFCWGTCAFIRNRQGPPFGERSLNWPLSCAPAFCRAVRLVPLCIYPPPRSRDFFSVLPWYEYAPPFPSSPLKDKSRFPPFPISPDRRYQSPSPSHFRFLASFTYDPGSRLRREAPAWFATRRPELAVMVGLLRI